MFNWLKKKPKDEADIALAARLMKAAAEGDSIKTLRQALSTINSNASATVTKEIAATTAAELAKEVQRKAVGTKLPSDTTKRDDIVFVTGYFALSFSNVFSYLCGDTFEIASNIAVIQAIGHEEWQRAFAAIIKLHNTEIQSNSRATQMLLAATENWAKNPNQQNLNQLCELYKIFHSNIS